MARNEQLIRQHKILQILERVRFGKTINELQQDIVEELGLTSIHIRTLKRDLAALQAAGVDVDLHDSARGKIWKLGPRAKSATKISASSTELIALSLGSAATASVGRDTFLARHRDFLEQDQRRDPGQRAGALRGLPQDTPCPGHAG